MKMALTRQKQIDNEIKLDIEIKQEPSSNNDIFVQHLNKTDLNSTNPYTAANNVQPVKSEIVSYIKSESNGLLKYRDANDLDIKCNIDDRDNPKCNVLDKSVHDESVILKDEMQDLDSEGEVSDSSLKLKDNQEKGKKKRKKSPPAKCSICKKTFHKKSYLTKHLWLHTGELPYKCQYCEKAFNVRGNLTLHLMIHTGQKPHDCPLCEKSFRQKSQLDIHMRTHTGERPYPCDVCSRSFRNSSALIIHQRIHTGERPFRCDICSRGFSTSTSLKTHRVTHSGKMLYECPVCGREFNRRNNLNVHIKRHDKNRKFHCPLCSNGFVMRAHVINHLKRSHNIDPAVAEIKYRELMEVFGESSMQHADTAGARLSGDMVTADTKPEEKFEIEIVNDCS